MSLSVSGIENEHAQAEHDRSVAGDFECSTDHVDTLRYSSAVAMQIVRDVETQATRKAVFDEIKSKNPIIRIVDRIYANAGIFQPLMLFAYMLKCIASIGPGTNPAARMVSIANFNNEKHAIDRICALVPEIETAALNLSNRHAMKLGQITKCLLLARHLPRHWQILRNLAKHHDFMPACRIASVLAYELWFDGMFKAQKQLKAALTASNYSPESVALAAAAHKNNRKVIYTNHAPVPANSAVVPPVLADCAVFYGKATQKTYEKRSHCSAKVFLIGQPGHTAPMIWKDSVKTVGIFLTALTSTATLAALVENIKEYRPTAQILIRHHPVALIETDLSQLQNRFSDIKITRGTFLDEDIAQCDLVICGNSGVTMNVLRGGRPVAYLNALDSAPYDYLGLVHDGLVYETDGWSEELHGKLRQFYGSDDWKGVMQDYDASYDQSQASLEKKASAGLRKVLYA